MTGEPQNGSDQGLTRRTVLRRGSIAAAVGVVGVGTFATPVAAHACPRTPGYWMNHRWPGESDDHVGLTNVNEHVSGVDFADEDEGRAFLARAARGDKGYIMAFHLVAFILNNQLACLTDVTTPVTDVDGDDEAETMLEIKGYAQEWLEESGWTSDGPALDSWTVPSATVSDGEVLKDLLDAYNNGTLFECSCEDEMDFENVNKGGNRGRSAATGRP